MRAAHALALIAASMLVAASKPPPRTPVFTGTLEIGFEQVSFANDDGRGPYWLSAESGAWEDLTAPLTENCTMPWGRVRVVVEGVLSEEGRHGHLGAYERELRVTNVREATFIACHGPPARP
jgi:hypothetical protein